VVLLAGKLQNPEGGGDGVTLVIALRFGRVGQSPAPRQQKRAPTTVS